MNYTQTNIKEQVFSNKIESVFDRCNIIKCIFNNVDFNDTIFNKCNIIECQFNNCDINSARLINCNIIKNEEPINPENGNCNEIDELL